LQVKKRVDSAARQDALTRLQAKPGPLNSAPFGFVSYRAVLTTYRRLRARPRTQRQRGRLAGVPQGQVVPGKEDRRGGRGQRVVGGGQMPQVGTARYAPEFRDPAILSLGRTLLELAMQIQQDQALPLHLCVVARRGSWPGLLVSLACLPSPFCVAEAGSGSGVWIVSGPGRGLAAARTGSRTQLWGTRETQTRCLALRSLLFCVLLRVDCGAKAFVLER
jgi:hypothetical protein